MFDDIDPFSNAFESLKSFCTTIGEGSLYPQKDELYYHYLDHPVAIGEKIMVIYDEVKKIIYLVQAAEGMGIDLNDPPFFYHWNIDGAPFPETACLDREGVTLGFPTLESTATTARKISHQHYQQLKALFDLENPFPWIEKDEREIPKLDDNYLPDERKPRKLNDTYLPL